MGLLDVVAADAHQAPRIRFQAPGGARAMTDITGAGQMPDRTLVIPRRRFDHLLQRHAIAAGARSGWPMCDNYCPKAATQPLRQRAVYLSTATRSMPASSSSPPAPPPACSSTPRWPPPARCIARPHAATWTASRARPRLGIPVQPASAAGLRLAVPDRCRQRQHRLLVQRPSAALGRGLAAAPAAGTPDPAATLGSRQPTRPGGGLSDPHRLPTCPQDRRRPALRRRGRGAGQSVHRRGHRLRAGVRRTRRRDHCCRARRHQWRHHRGRAAPLPARP